LKLTLKQAKEFVVFDKWFCSLPGPTDPNRAFAMSGTSDGLVTNFNGTLESFNSATVCLLPLNLVFYSWHVCV
jgi:phospholipase C